jgi:hypothetical protein
MGTVQLEGPRVAMILTLMATAAAAGAKGHHSAHM